MDDLILRRNLLAAGYQRDEIARMRHRGELIGIRRGVYVEPPEQPPPVRDVHERLLRACLHDISPEAVVSHESAALLHDLPVWGTRLERVHFTRDRSSGGRRGRQLHLHSAPLADGDVVELAGVRVTSLARTVADLSRTLPYRQAVAAGDQALAAGLDRDQLEQMLGRMRHWPGVAGARRVAAFLDGRSESPGESLSRVVLDRLGLLPVELQYEVFGPTGTLAGRSDFGWPEQRTLGEFDGRVKYGRLLRPGQTAADVLFAEKQREDALRDLGWQVVRWIWDDLQRPQVIRDRLQRAFARAAR
ncbi:hypothetical protein GCM10009841_13910 [Microlunatus panaciterrae]|uniref:Transcriptional regulator, AbiEi antitoxin, Type IV TA system n=1 Tax=Microlunatus panaciterrae TaxID=400768 RepID=A0ABS2RP44_9ACTN|nr:hypothetical protein [Microlunatus panaciterrae]MBM7799951.1 hypothetical protein [Microlunatus panaciterrae]